MKLRHLFRDVVHNRGQAMIFALCVALSLVSLIAVNSFRRDVRGVIASDAATLQGGDIIVRSSGDLSPGLAAELAAIIGEGGGMATESWEFYSVARKESGDDFLFSNIKAVADGYPLYGTVELASGRPFTEALRPGDVIVGRTLLDRLGLAIGDFLLLGQARLRIADVVVREPQRPVDFFNFGPRIFMRLEDMAATDLVGKGSRSTHQHVLKLEDRQRQGGILARLQGKAGDGERVFSAADSGSRIKRFFDNLLFFLSLIAVFTLLLSGIGMQSSLAALLRRQVKSVAILRALGANNRFLLGHFLGLVLLLGLGGVAIGIGGGLLIKLGVLRLLEGLLPENLVLETSLADLAQGLGFGLVAVLFFTSLPLAQLAAIKPSAIFRKEIGGGLRRAAPRVLLAVGLGLLTAVVILQLEDVATGLWFMGGAVGLVLVMTLLAHLALAGLASCEYSSLYLRQAVRSLSRPGNASRTVVVTLASALAVLFSIYLVEKNLRSAFIESYPPEAPNLFFLDIQKDQRQEFVELVGGGAELFPVVRARLQAINDRTIDRRSEAERRGDSLAREFSLTYHDHLLDGEKLIAGQGLFGPAHRSSTLPPVSLLDSVVEIGGIKIGDVLHFSIQGVSLKAEVASIRSRTKSMLYPFFYFVFPEQTLRAAPQTFFAALRVAEDQVGALENRMVRRFPNVSPIHVGQSAAELGRLMAKLSLLVAFFASFSLLAGGLILVGSILATRLARLEEAVHYKILGADTAFVLKIFSLENVFLALLSCGAAVLVAEVGSWALCRLVLDILYRPHPLAALLLLAAVAILVLALGLITSLSVIVKKPGSYLREQSP